MIGFLRNLFARGETAIADVVPRDAAAIAKLHAASFRRGWSDGDVEQLLMDAHVVADRARIGRKLVGFVMARHAAEEAEILSIAVDASARGRGLGRALLQRNLQRLAGLGVREVFLEVGADNAPALALYRRMGFVQVGKRDRYYGNGSDGNSTALVLRREIG